MKKILFGIILFLLFGLTGCSKQVQYEKAFHDVLDSDSYKLNIEWRQVSPNFRVIEWSVIVDGDLYSVNSDDEILYYKLVGNDIYEYIKDDYDVYVLNTTPSGDLGMFIPEILYYENENDFEQIDNTWVYSKDKIWLDSEHINYLSEIIFYYDDILKTVKMESSLSFNDRIIIMTIDMIDINSAIVIIPGNN